MIVPSCGQACLACLIELHARTLTNGMSVSLCVSLCVCTCTCARVASFLGVYLPDVISNGTWSWSVAIEHKSTQARTHTHTRTHTQAGRHTHTHTHTHTHAHTHTYIIQVQHVTATQCCSQQRRILGDLVTEDAWSCQAVELLLQFEMYKSSTR
jgi:L-lactate permease